MEFNKKINLAVDCDEVLTYIAPWWVAIMCKNYDYFGKYLNLDKEFEITRDFGKVLARNNFKLDIEYRKDGVTLDEEFYKVFYDIINNDEFYSLMTPTRMAKTIKEISETSYINSLHIVTRSPKNNHNGKIKFLEEFFGKEVMAKTTIHILKLTEKKSDCINKIGNINAVYDDELNNVYDIMRNTNKKEMDIYIPKLGYNYPKENMFDIAVEHNKAVKYYDVV